MFTTIKINKFRAIEKETFNLGKYITMFAGWNATGKSTILALMANSTELKREYGVTYNGKPFKAEFSEILKGSLKFDPTESDKLQILHVDGDKIRTKSFRTAWQENNTRYRVIPKEKLEGGKITEAKYEFPVIYLGLSRLYPIGEIDDKFISNTSLKFDNDEDKNWFINKHMEILSNNDKITDVSDVSLRSTKKKMSGVSTNRYDWKTNSSGQDNLGQILLSILSFKKIKREMQDSYKGGLLIIDELEASLHPKAQEKLLELFIKEARSNNIQILFTTHSLTLISKFCEKNSKENPNLKHYYFTKVNNTLKIYENYDYKDIEEDLLVSLYQRNNKSPKIVVYTEDEENRWLLKKLIEGYVRKLEYRNVSIGCQCIIDLMNSEPIFKDYLVVFDGDLKATDEKRIKNCKNNYIKLPTYPETFCSPEKLLRDFIFSDKSKKYFEEENKKNSRIKIEYFREHDLPTDDSLKERDKYKKWFNIHKKLFEDSNIVKYWKAENQDLVDNFLQNFKKTYNYIAKRKNIEEIV